MFEEAILGTSEVSNVKLLWKFQKHSSKCERKARNSNSRPISSFEIVQFLA